MCFAGDKICRSHRPFFFAVRMQIAIRLKCFPYLCSDGNWDSGSVMSRGAATAGERARCAGHRSALFFLRFCFYFEAA